MQEAIDKLDGRVINIFEHAVVDTLETCSVNHNKAFIKGALRKALNPLLLATQDDTSGIWKYFGDKIIQLAAQPK